MFSISVTWINCHRKLSKDFFDLIKIQEVFGKDIFVIFVVMSKNKYFLFFPSF